MATLRDRSSTILTQRARSRCARRAFSGAFVLRTSGPLHATAQSEQVEHPEQPLTRAPAHLAPRLAGPDRTAQERPLTHGTANFDKRRILAIVRKLSTTPRRHALYSNARDPTKCDRPQATAESAPISQRFTDTSDRTPYLRRSYARAKRR
jgi:hypothetical protein